MMPSICGEQQWCFYILFFSIVLQRRKVSSAPKPRTIEAARNVEKVRYTTGGGGGSVGLRQSQSYEAAVYEDEEVYEVPNT